MFYCVYIGNSKVSNTDKFQLSLGEKNVSVKQNCMSNASVFVLSGIALSVKFSISWSEISANGRDAIVSFFPRIQIQIQIRDWSK